MVDEKLCDERHDTLSEELQRFREHCEVQHQTNEGQIIRIHERLDVAQDKLTELKDSMNGCFHSAKNYLIVTAVTIIMTLIGTIVTLAVNQTSKKSDLMELERRMAIQFQVSQDNNIILKGMIENSKNNKK